MNKIVQVIELHSKDYGHAAKVLLEDGRVFSIELVRHHSTGQYFHRWHEINLRTEAPK